MSSSLPGAVISHSEVTNISAVGFWMLVDDKEYFVALTTIQFSGMQLSPKSTPFSV